MTAVRVSYEAEGWGVGEVWLEDRRLVWHELPRPQQLVDARVNGEPHLPPRWLEPNGARVTRGGRLRDDTVAAHELVERIRAYFAGDEDDFGNVELDLAWCTPFQRAAVDVLRAVPRGETVTYGELAALAGAPNAQRAAGTFCARNRYGLVVPCHRVVAADGVGSYGSLGVEYKRRLLVLEGAL